MIAVVSPSRTSTSGRARAGMKPCTKALYVSLISRCDSAAIVPNTSELLPEPEMPVNTVSRRLGISMLTSLRLFTRAPSTRIRSWLSATCSRAAREVSVLVAMSVTTLGDEGALRFLEPARFYARPRSAPAALRLPLVLGFHACPRFMAGFSAGASKALGQRHQCDDSQHDRHDQAGG